ncbi:glycosyl hydrolase family 1 domain-containing protein [Phthorimaea operculella]|nr:glycosyl hydrolase family 1 domain-containing protein [Phthorimaea operculella]
MQQVNSNKLEDFAAGPNGTTACDSYHNYMRDVDMLRELGVDHYRFSIAWSRVLPDGLATNINKKGLEFYQNLTEELYKWGIQPMAVMYYNDLPQALEDLGGWTNNDVVHWFEEYARVLYKNLPRISVWITINDPSRCFEMYDDNKFPPGKKDKGVSDYKCVKNMLLAHARAYRVYKNEFQGNISTTGLVGMSLALDWANSVGDSSAVELQFHAQIYRAFTMDLYLHPLLAPNGDWPEFPKMLVRANSRKEGFENSRLPDFTPEEIEELKGALDFVGINYYTKVYVSPLQPGQKMVYKRLPLDLDFVKVTQADEWRPSKTPGRKAFSTGVYYICDYLKIHYDNPPMLITEFGWSTDVGLKDDDRVDEIFDFMQGVLMAIKDNIDLRGVTIWSLMDSIQWTAGATERYGLYEVDFDSPEKTRRPRLSALYYRKIIDTENIKKFTQPPKKINITVSPRKTRKIRTIITNRPLNLKVKAKNATVVKPVATIEITAEKVYNADLTKTKGAENLDIASKPATKAEHTEF